MASKKKKMKSRSRSKSKKNIISQEKVLDLLVVGFFTGMGTIIGTVIAKYLLTEAGKNLPLPNALHSAIVNIQ